MFSSEQARLRMGGALGLAVLFMFVALYALASSKPSGAGLWFYTPLMFVIAVVIVFGIGWWKTFSVLDRYASEESELKSTACLEQLRKEVVPTFEQGLSWRFNSTPLFNLRYKETLRAFRRGVALSEIERGEAEGRYFAPEERYLRAMMDSALNLGIAGTFVSILLSLTQQSENGLSVGDLLAHLGPGLASGLSAVAFNISLRICHSTLLARQEALAESVDSVLEEELFAQMGTKLLSPDARLLEGLKPSLDRLLEGLQTPLRELTEQTRTLAHSSSQWGQTADRLENAFEGILNRENRIAKQHEERGDALSKRLSEEFAGISQALGSLVKTMQETHQKAIDDSLEKMQERYKIWMTRQRTEYSTWFDEAMANYRALSQEHFREVTLEMKETLNALRAELPDVLREGMEGAFDGVSRNLSDLQEASSEMASALDQTRQSSDRHLVQSGELHSRIEAWQERQLHDLERLQKVFGADLEGWRSRSETLLLQMGEFYPALQKREQERMEGVVGEGGRLTDAVGRVASEFANVEQRAQTLGDTAEKLTSTLRAQEERSAIEAEQLTQALERRLQQVSRETERLERAELESVEEEKASVNAT